jgi:hypothetical protein
MDTNDLILDEEFDLLIQGGDIVVDRAADQRAMLILHTSQGEWKQSPLVGVGIKQSLNGAVSGAFLNSLNANIRKQIEADGLIVNKIQINESNITLEVSE